DDDAAHRLEDHRPRVDHGLAHRHAAGDLEGDVLAVDGVGRAVDEAHLDVDDRVPRHRALFAGLTHALLDTGAELLRDAAADDLVLPFETRAPGKGLDLDGAVAVEAGTAGLLLVLVLHARGADDGLPVGDA